MHQHGYGWALRSWVTALVLAAAVGEAAELRVRLPLGRTLYQTNERIDISVLRRDSKALAAAELTLAVEGAGGSRMTFVFPVKAAPLVAGEAQTAEHLKLNGWLLRPDTYTATVAADGATAQTSFTVYSHLRKTDYRLIHWGGARNAMMTIEGEDGLGFNLAMGETGESSIAGGQDVMGSCLMGGGHQHDLRNTNDWSDPNVYLGAIQRGVDRAFAFRTMPNAIGAHLHDEPGLTWLPHPHLKDKDGKPLMCAHDIPFQRAAYLRAYGEEMPWFDTIDTRTPESLAQWERLNDFKLGFMDAFWKASRQALEKMKPGYLPVTQSQYGWMALFDGYYCNVVRSLPVVSGHGGYSHYWLFNLNPSFYLEISLPRQLDKPTWYLPEWGTTDLDGLRQVQCLSFITGIQGIAQWPGINIDSPHAGAIVETNRIFARLGPIFTRPAYTPQPVTILYSKSNAYFNKEHTQLQDLAALYVATRLTQYPVSFVLDEDILDGTLAAGHKAVIIAGVTYLDPTVIAGLEAFAAQGGVVLTTADTTVSIAGAVRLEIVPGALAVQAEEALKQITAAAQRKEAEAKARSFRAWLEYAEPTAQALKATLAASGIAPAFECDLATVAPGRQVRGDIEYLFAVNLTPAEGYSSTVCGGFGKPVAAQATLALADDGRPVYNAVTGQPMPFAKKGGKLSAAVSFGPGQMLALARPARAIGGVQVGTPAVSRDFTRDNDSIRLEFAATLVDTQNQLLAGAAPLRLTVTDPLGVVRYDLYRATENGVCTLSLPLAANDPAGTWTVTVAELLSNTAATASCSYQPAAQCGVLAGVERRALYFAPDQANVFSFFRTHRQIAIVAGSSDYAAAAASRLAAALRPYEVTATIVPLAEAAKARPLTDEQAATWCGTSTAGSLDASARANPQLAGYNLPQPTVLLGSPADHPLIKRLLDAKVLPYTLSADFPGPGRGLITWNVMTLGHDVEAIACIADDAAGLSEAVGTLFTLAVGLDPVTPLALPASSRVTPASRPTGRLNPAATLWRVALPDRVAAVTVADGGRITATAVNRTQMDLSAAGKVLKTREIGVMSEAPKLAADATRLPQDKLHRELRPKQVLAGSGQTAVTYWGGRLQVFTATGELKSEQQMHQDITALAWDGEVLLAGLADGWICALRPGVGTALAQP
jgi:hypothetical protein